MYEKCMIRKVTLTKTLNRNSEGKTVGFCLGVMSNCEKETKKGVLGNL